MYGHKELIQDINDWEDAVMSEFEKTKKDIGRAIGLEQLEENAYVFSIPAFDESYIRRKNKYSVISHEQQRVLFVSSELKCLNENLKLLLIRKEMKKLIKEAGSQSSSYCSGLCPPPECCKTLNEDAGILLETNSGPFFGKHIKVYGKDLAAFLLVPYGKPPIRESKSSNTEPLEVWEKSIFGGNPLSSLPFSIRKVHCHSKKECVIEDFLYLNIWTPISSGCGDSGKFPVLVWLHKGRFADEKSSMEYYDGSSIASYEDLIIVAINYSLGVFGLLYAGIEEDAKILGLFIKLIALKWINTNIQHFGGDPNFITILVDYDDKLGIEDLLNCPLSKSLFHKVIMLSGSDYNLHFTEDFYTECRSTEIFEYKKKTFAGGQIKTMQSLKNKSIKVSQAKSLFPLFCVPTFSEGILLQHPRKKSCPSKENLPEIRALPKNDKSVFDSSKFEHAKTEEKGSLPINDDVHQEKVTSSIPTGMERMSRSRLHSIESPGKATLRNSHGIKSYHFFIQMNSIIF